MANRTALELAEVLRREPCAWSSSALADRWGRAAFRAATRRGQITRIVPGIYVASEHSLSFAARSHAALLWCGPESVIVGQGAASVWGLCDVPELVEIATPYGSNHACPSWLRVRRLPVPVPHALWGPRRVARTDWAAVTAYATAPLRARDRALYRAAQSGKVSAADLQNVALQLPRIRGRTHLNQVLAAIEAGSESHLESVGLRTVFNTAEFSEFVRQHWIRTRAGNYRLDMFHPASRTAVELDGAGTHGEPSDRQRDITRDANVAAEGILTLRLSTADIYDRASWCREVVKRTTAARS